MESIYLHEIKPGDNGDLEKKAVKRALKIIQQSSEEVNTNIFSEWVRPTREEEYVQIKNDYDNAGSTIGERGSHRIFSKKTYNVIERVRERWELPKYSIISKGTEEGEDAMRRSIEDAIIKKGVELVLREAGLKRAFSGKGGIKFKTALFGDCFIMIKPKKKGSFPVSFQLVPINRVYINPEAIDMRGAADGQNVRRMSILLDYDYDTFVEEFGEIEGLKWGDIPSLEAYNNMDKTRSQQSQEDLSRPGQILINFDLDSKTYMICAGANCKIIKEEKGDDYPYYLSYGKNKVPYIPISRFYCRERSEGFWSFGFGHLMSEINQADDYMKNQYLLALQKATNPMDLITVQKGKEQALQYAIELAQTNIARGEHGVVVNTVDDTGNPLFGQVSKLTSGDPGQAYERFQGTISDRDVIGFGFNEQDVSTPASKTATAVEAETLAAESAIQVLNEQNAPEFKFIIEVTLDFIRKFVSKTDNTPINTQDITMPEGLLEEATKGLDKETVEELRPELESELKKSYLKGITLGYVKELLNKRDYDVEIEVGTGLKSTSTRRIQQKRMLLELTAGTKAQGKAIKDIASELGTTLSDKDLEPIGEPQAPKMSEVPV